MVELLPKLFSVNNFGNPINRDGIITLLQFRSLLEQKKLEKMKLICLQYAAAAQWLMSYSIYAPTTDDPTVDKFKKLKLRIRSQMLKVESENPTVIESILKFEAEFSAELQSLGPLLSSSSRAEPYLTHLAQWLLGVGKD